MNIEQVTKKMDATVRDVAKFEFSRNIKLLPYLDEDEIASLFYKQKIRFYDASSRYSFKSFCIMSIRSLIKDLKQKNAIRSRNFENFAEEIKENIGSKNSAEIREDGEIRRTLQLLSRSASPEIFFDDPNTESVRKIPCGSTIYINVRGCINNKDIDGLKKLMKRYIKSCGVNEEDINKIDFDKLAALVMDYERRRKIRIAENRRRGR